MGGTTNATSGTTSTPPPVDTSVPEQCRAITDPEKQMHCAIDANNRDTFATKLTLDPVGHTWGGVLEYHPSMRGVGFTMEGAGNEKLGGVGGQAGGKLAISFTGALTPKVAITLGGEFGVGYQDAGTTKYVTAQLSSLAMVRYAPTDYVSFHLSAKANLRATGGWNAQKANDDVTLGKAVATKLQADVTAAETAFGTGVQADLQTLSPDAQQRLQTAIAPALQNFSSGLTPILASAIFNPGAAQTQLNNLVQNTQTQVMTATNTALGGAASDFEAKIRVRVTDFQTALSAAFSNAISNGTNASNPTDGSFSANLDISGGASFHVPIGHTSFYLKSGIDGYVQQPLLGQDTHTVMVYEHNPTKQTIGLQPTLGIGYKNPKLSTGFVELSVTPDLSISGGRVNKIPIPLTFGAGLRF